MATIGSRVWVLTAADIGVIVWKDWENIKFIEWYNVPAQGNTFILQDRNSAVIVEGVAEGGGTSQTFNLENWYQGLRLAQLDGGTLLVHVK